MEGKEGKKRLCCCPFDAHACALTACWWLTAALPRCSCCRCHLRLLIASVACCLASPSTHAQAFPLLPVSWWSTAGAPRCPCWGRRTPKHLSCSLVDGGISSCMEEVGRSCDAAAGQLCNMEHCRQQVGAPTGEQSRRTAAPVRPAARPPHAGYYVKRLWPMAVQNCRALERAQHSRPIKAQQ